MKRQRHRLTASSVEILERRQLMADFRVISLALVDEDFILSTSPSITLAGTNGDRIYQRINYATTSVPSAPDVEYRFTTLGSTRIAKDSTLSVPPSGTGNWTIWCGWWQTSNAGTYEATATLDATNLIAETDETNNSATITYNAVAAPEIRVYGLNSNKIVDNQAPTAIEEGTDFGFVSAGGPPADRTFTVTNVGVMPLTTSNLVVPNGFTVVESLSPMIASGGSDTFTLRTQTSQAIHGQVTFITNDLNEGAFNFPIQVNIPRPVATSTSLDVSVSPARVLVGFNTNVGASITGGDFTITNTTTGQAVSKIVSYNTATNTATIAFTNAPANGRYRLTASASAVTDSYGNPLASPISYDFSYVRSDVDGDAVVGFNDLLIVAQNYGKNGQTFAQGNVDYSPDGIVNFNDLLIVAQQYGTVLQVADPIAVRRNVSDVLP